MDTVVLVVPPDWIDTAASNNEACICGEPMYEHKGANLTIRRRRDQGGSCPAFYSRAVLTKQRAEIEARAAASAKKEAAAKKKATKRKKKIGAMFDEGKPGA